MFSVPALRKNKQLVLLVKETTSSEGIQKVVDQLPPFVRLASRASGVGGKFLLSWPIACEARASVLLVERVFVWVGLGGGRTSGGRSFGVSIGTGAHWGVSAQGWVTRDEVAVIGIEKAAKIEKLVLRVTGSKVSIGTCNRIPVIENE